MHPLGRAPPVVGLALALAAGASLRHLGVSPLWTLPLLPSLLLPNRSSFRPRRPSRPGRLFRRGRFPGSEGPAGSTPAGLSGQPRHPLGPWSPLLLAFLAGGFLTDGWYRREASDCRLFFRDGESLEFRGRLMGAVVEGRGEVRPRATGPRGCSKPLRVVFPGPPSPDLAPWATVFLRGEWRQSGRGGTPSPLYAGYLRVEEAREAVLPAPPAEAFQVLGARVHARLAELFPEGNALAAALVLARKEGLAADLREAFARAGVAHLLAISGFHVGVAAGILLLGGGLLGLPHGVRFLLAGIGVWAYVLGIGLPDAALRAALILTALAVGRFLARPVVPLGALAAALLVFLPLDPGALLRPGFQLSFAGALGLILGSRSWGESIHALTGGRISRNLTQALGAGIAATLATLPLVVWHFGRVSLVGIPVTLLAAPLVTVAIPGIFATLLLSVVHPSLGAFLARGVEMDLGILETLVRTAAAFPLASAWVSRPALVAGVGGGGLALLALHAMPGRAGGRRALGVTTGIVAGLLLWPLGERALGRGTLEMVVLDVGQGDALLLRSPRGRWVLVDTGPRTGGLDAGERIILPYLRRRGATALDLLVLTHPDLDHIGGAPALLAGIAVRGVLDPGDAAGKEALLEALEAAQIRSVPWHVAAAGDSLDLDGVALRVVAPEGLPTVPGGAMEGGEEEGTNGASLVLELRYGTFAALLTGDAPAASEVRFLPRLLSPRVQVLKVGHHGSASSTTPELLERAAPEAALISVGRRNRFGHPRPDVLQRLERAGARIYRTDLEGTLVVKARPDGTFRVDGGG